MNDTVSSLSEVLKRFDEVKRTFEIPTQICVLGHITTQIEAVRNGAPADMIFQSIAGSEKGNRAFGFSAQTVREAMELLQEKGTGQGPDVLYFETGQGSELSSDAHYGADQVTMEARCYGFARQFHPFMVNTVVGFIGPEYLYDSRQVIRAGLEDHFMGKLTGIPMGCDCCYTNHMMADQNDIENLSLLLASSGVNYILGVPAGDDVMLNYQTNAYHDAAAIREILGLRPIREFDQWLEKNGDQREREADEICRRPYAVYPAGRWNIMALSEQQIRQIAEAVLAELAAAGKLPQKSCGLKQPQDEKALRRMLRTTTARIGIGNAGPRLKTQTLLTLRADHAAARGRGYDGCGSGTVRQSGAVHRPDLLQ